MDIDFLDLDEDTESRLLHMYLYSISGAVATVGLLDPGLSGWESAALVACGAATGAAVKWGLPWLFTTLLAPRARFDPERAVDAAADEVRRTLAKAERTLAKAKDSLNAVMRREMADGGITEGSRMEAVRLGEFEDDVASRKAALDRLVTSIATERASAASRNGTEA